MHQFSYVRPTSLEEALRALQHSPEALPLAGGMSLLSAMKLRLAAPTHLVDLAGVPQLCGVREEGSSLVVGAMTRHAEVAASPIVKRCIPALAALAAGIGDRQVRNRGTIAGSIANADPAADYPSAVLGLNATIVTSRREIAGDDFFTGLFETALAPGELITAVRFPIPQKAAYVKFHQPASRFALVGVFAAIDRKGAPRIAVTGAKAFAFRALEVEEIIRQHGLAPDAVLGLQLSAQDMNHDLHADAEYRAHLVAVIASRAVDCLLRVER
ncbi:MAG: carbon monoxide dehydrogenase [Paucimonas sp.]|nr:carbon monoxide dehydrogenase [Paucimonas sp.]